MLYATEIFKTQKAKKKTSKTTTKRKMIAL